MEQSDLELEQRVWERIAGESREATPTPSLIGMEMRCRESAAIFKALTSTTSGEFRERLNRLSKEEQNNAMTLLGMRILAGEEPQRTPPYPAGKRSLALSLAQAFRQSRQARKDYLACTAWEEYGPVFSQMAEEEGRRMMELLALIGMTRG